MSENTLLIDIGKRISSQRKRIGMTQEQVAESINISTQSLSCIELGKKAIRPENLINLCNTLNVSTDYILMGKRTTEQIEGVTKKIALLNEDDYHLIETIVEHLNKR